MSKVNSAAATIERVARSLYEMVEDDDDSDGEIEFMPQPHSAGGLPRLPRLPHRRGANATRAARVVHRNNRSSNAAGGGSLSASSSPAKSGGGGGGGGSCSPRRDSNQRIKELVLSQFDLIKKQSDDIVRKDQQLRDLQRDNEKLKARLKLLELKNVEHEKKTKLRPPGKHTQATETELRDCVDKHLNVASAQQQTPPAAAADFATKQEAQTSAAKRQKRRSAPAPAAIAAASAPKAKRAKSSGQSEEVSKSAKSPEFVGAARPFFVLEGEEFVRREKEEVKSILRFAEVPGWREKTVPVAASRTSGAASEPTDDDAYLKRHGKPELEERRRKRWDMQRIREQRHIERLKARYDQANAATAVAVAAPKTLVPPKAACKGRGGDRCCELGACLLEEGGRTLMNDPLGITHVHVLTPAGEELQCSGDDDVPVSAFGHRIPELAAASTKSSKAGHFQLPWTKSSSNSAG